MLVGLAGPLGACAPHAIQNAISQPPQTRGNRIDPEVLAQLVPGTSSRADATALLGSPTAKGAFDDDTWLYISLVTQPVITGTLALRDQNVVMLTFDRNGVLQSIDKRGLDDRQDVSIVAATTPTPGSNATILQQLLGNVGKFNTGGIGGGQVGGPSSGGSNF